MISMLDAVVECLTHGRTTIWVDTNAAGVEVPPHYTDGILVLNLSWKFDGCDMRLDEDALRATLTFNGELFRCVIPWTAINAVQQNLTPPAPKKPTLRLVK